ncbi:zinc-finger domain-containing protein [Bacillus sp. FSL K6-0067]|uniref:zinc-finger domain-containing protein n=1 Tax=Bacillus sp. FSL K6-0067 TaxID=2921412 RepID=UPI00077A30BC|nr:zinc-finger domain-containing protein [Bacillus cereus]KXY34875.1 hypothetical protein AT267_00440 [Bacillus cereus]
MNDRKKRIRILDIQDQYCQTCEYQMQPLKKCIQHCTVGQELKTLARELFPESKRCNPREDWDEICKQAVKLYEEGFGNTIISKKLGCPTSTLREQLKRRGLWQGKTQAEIQEQSQKKWDDWCQRALKLREQGFSYPKIAQQLGVHASKLRDQIRKRGLGYEQL